MLAVGSDTAIENREGRLRLLLLQGFPVKVQNVLKFYSSSTFMIFEVIVIVCFFTESQRNPLMSDIQLYKIVENKFRKIILV